MKHILFLLLALMVGPLLLAQENESQFPDTSLFEALHRRAWQRQLYAVEALHQVFP